MVKKLKQSLIDQSGMALSLVILLAVINMLVSFLIAESSENDGVRINLAGSLRMQSFRIATLVMIHREKDLNNVTANVADQDQALDKEIEAFRTRLYTPVLYNYIANSDQEKLKRAYEDVERQWNTFKSQIKLMGSGAIFADVSKFVRTIDILVKALELQTEEKFKTLRMMQGVFLLISICIVIPAFYQIYVRVVGPLRAMIAIASQVRGGDFSKRLDTKGDDELSQLADTFNEMIDSIDAMYINLETKVVEKTVHLEKVQKGLRLLYEASRRLSSEDDFIRMLEVTLRNLQQYLGSEHIDIYFSENAGSHMATISSGKIISVTLDNVVRNSSIEEINKNPKTKAYLLARGDVEYGVLVVSRSEFKELDEEQEELMTALLDTIVSAISHEVRKDQQHRLALMEERSAIARELHDSLAQSLSYTKIQVSRVQLLQKQNAEPAALEEALTDIRTGIHSAYQQLREILATFRLQLNSNGLESSLQMTVKEYEEKSDLNIDLLYELSGNLLSPNAEVHVLQIVREALSNVVRHSGASSVRIIVQTVGADQIQVKVCDNGCGFTAENIGPNHYGKTIMRERAAILNGNISFSDQADGGAEVLLVFNPNRGQTN